MRFPRNCAAHPNLHLPRLYSTLPTLVARSFIPIFDCHCFLSFNCIFARLSTNDITSLVDDMYNFMSLNASDPTSAFQTLTDTMRVLHAVVQSIDSYPLAAKAKDASPRSLAVDSGSRSGGMRLRLADGSGAEELLQAWRAVLSTLLRIHNRLEGWPLQQVGTKK